MLKKRINSNEGGYNRREIRILSLIALLEDKFLFSFFCCERKVGKTEEIRFFEKQQKTEAIFRCQFHQYFILKPFLYKSVLRSFSLVTVKLGNFFVKAI